MKKSTVTLRLSALVMIVFAMLLLTGASVARSQDKVEYISPRPGARLVSPGTTLAIRPGGSLDEATVKGDLFKVVGTRSGLHPGSAVLADDHATVIFKPQQPFAPGENVNVSIDKGIRLTSGRELDHMAFAFTISPQEVTAQPTQARSLLDEVQPITPNVPTEIVPRNGPTYVTLPPDFPPITVTTSTTGTGDGYVFITPFSLSILTPYLIIADNSGQPVYYKPVPSFATDFKRQPNGLLTYWTGGQFYAMDNSYNVVDTYQAGNGYTADAHDLQLLPDGHALLMAYDNQPVDMSQIAPGGLPTATVTGLIVQELDTSKNVVFEWRSWDHFNITDTMVPLTTTVVDYVHGNAIELDTDGNLLLSSRHMSEITKINRQSGDIIWRLGGKNNQFTFVNDPAPHFDFQHDIRRLPNGDITLFDNRTNLTPLYSRAVEYHLDEGAKTATLVWQYRNTPDTFGLATGNVQRLSNGNTFIGWGFGLLATEVTPEGSKAFELALAPNFSYRAFRFPWHGYPNTQPTLVIQTTTLTTTLTFSWNGATDIASYRIYGGNEPRPTTLITTQAKTDFETQIVLPNTANGCLYFRVMPIDATGWETRYSNEVTACYGLQLNYLPMIAR